MIAATHVLIFAEDPQAARAFLRDVLGWEHVDAGDGWLIFALPPSELGVHPAEPNESGRHELFLMCHDVEKTREELETKGVEFTSPIEDQGFGLITRLKIPGAGELQLYEPKHLSPLEEFDARTSPDRE
jgi:catechol 2,3-dioxygenase-like lactoylglutathione lyase family enzyme